MATESKGLKPPAAKTSARKEGVRLQLYIDRAKLKKLKLLAVEQDKTMTELVMAKIDEILKGR
jgi:hypothetical protein